MKKLHKSMQLECSLVDFSSILPRLLVTPTRVKCRVQKSK